MSQTPNAQPRGGPSPESAPTAGDDGGIAGIDVPTPSTRTIIILAIVGIALFLLLRRIRSSGDDGASAANGGGDDGDDDDADEIPVADDMADAVEAIDEEFGDDDGESVQIEVPINPESELEKDEAVIEGLKQNGFLEVLDE